MQISYKGSTYEFTPLERGSHRVSSAQKIVYIVSSSNGRALTVGQGTKSRPTVKKMSKHIRCMISANDTSYTIMASIVPKELSLEIEAATAEHFGGSAQATWFLDGVAMTLRDFNKNANWVNAIAATTHVKAYPLILDQFTTGDDIFERPDPITQDTYKEIVKMTEA